jgi:two-component system, NtrC family, sensor kinase
MIGLVKLGTRLTVMLLLAVTPVIIGYAWWSVQRSTKAYIADLREAVRTGGLGLAPALENDLRENEWAQVRDVLNRMSTDSTSSALLSPDGRVWYGPAGFPDGLLPSDGQIELAAASGSTEFERWLAKRYWFCRLIRLDVVTHSKPAYLLVAQDWTNISEDLRERALVSVMAALLVVGVIATIIPYVVRRYVSDPLGELSRKVMRFSNDGELELNVGKDELKLLTQEFRRLDEQLMNARADLMTRHERELTLERQLQRTERLATIGTLAAGLAHEIGTPMGVIRGRAEFLLHGQPEPAMTREGLQIIISQIDRISRIVRMLLDYARERESLRVDCDVRSVIEYALGLMETEAKRRGITIRTDLGDHPVFMECDADQLQQVFINLSMNALDAMTPEGGSLEVRARLERGSGIAPLAKITFEDTGPGVPPENRARVFDPFFSTKDVGKGTGMGLAVSQSIIRDHDGEIALETGPAGTRFTISMPIASSRARPHAAATTESTG